MLHEWRSQVAFVQLCTSERGETNLLLTIHETCIDGSVNSRNHFCRSVGSAKPSSDLFDALRPPVLWGRAMFALGSYLGFQSKSCRSLREQSGGIKRFRLEMKRDGRGTICRIAESKNIFSYVQVFIFASRVGDT